MCFQLSSHPSVVPKLYLHDATWEWLTSSVTVPFPLWAFQCSYCPWKQAYPALASYCLCFCLCGHGQPFHSSFLPLPSHTGLLSLQWLLYPFCVLLPHFVFLAQFVHPVSLFILWVISVVLSHPLQLSLYSYHLQLFKEITGLQFTCRLNSCLLLCVTGFWQLLLHANTRGASLVWLRSALQTQDPEQCEFQKRYSIKLFRHK